VKAAKQTKMALGLLQLRRAKVNQANTRTQVPRSTKVLVSHVTEFQKEYPLVVEGKLNAMVFNCLFVRSLLFLLCKR
jgi:hypothetical protein